MFSEGLCREKKQLKKLRFWKWSPKTICYNLPSGRFFLIQNHSTLLKGGGDFLLSLLSGVGGQLVKHRTGIQNSHSQHLNI